MPDVSPSSSPSAPAVCLEQPAAAPRPESRHWVPEIRFGHWFLGTKVWTRYVVEVALKEFVRLLPASTLLPLADGSIDMVLCHQTLVREAGFEFGPEHVTTATPFWTQPDWGLTRRLGWRKKRLDEQPTEVTMVAFKPGRGA